MAYLLIPAWILPATFIIMHQIYHVLSINTIHQQLNIEDIRTIFHVDKHSDVPEYEVIQFHAISKREVPKNIDKGQDKILQLKAFGKKHELSLQPSKQLFKGNLKMWSAESNGNGSVSYTELPDTYIGEPYQDEVNQAALLLHEDNDDGSLLMEGTIGHDLVVKPLPVYIRQYIKNNITNIETDEKLIDKVAEKGEDQIAKERLLINNDIETDLKLNNLHHVVYRRHLETPDKFSDFAFMEDGDIDTVNNRHIYKKRRKRSIKKREAPYTIYPEILVIVDYDGYRLHGGDNVQVKRYFVSFWNGVDLRYKLLKGPKVRISIAGLIISRGRDATPYLERNRVGRDAVDSAAALTDMGKYLFRERRLPVYDIAVAVTKLDMCRRHYQNDICNRGTAGFAYVGGACVVNKRLEKVNSVAIIEDTGGFSGIIVAAHEVGHLLGAVHDGSPPPTYLGGPGAEKCRWEDGFIMSDLRHSEKGFKWSPCSVASFHHFLNGDTATCLFNSPHEDESLPRVLPGKLLSLDAQCRRDRGTSACFKDERVCSQLFCFDSGSGYCVAYRPAAEGSPCGDGQTCANGICIAEHENIIPDYSQNSPTFARRQDTDAVYSQSRQYGDNSTQRSDWEEIWRTATELPANIKPNFPNYYYVQNTTSTHSPYDPYKQLEKIFNSSYDINYRTSTTDDFYLSEIDGNIRNGSNNTNKNSSSNISDNNIKIKNNSQNPKNNSNSNNKNNNNNRKNNNGDANLNNEGKRNRNRNNKHIGRTTSHPITKNAFEEYTKLLLSSLFRTYSKNNFESSYSKKPSTNYSSSFVKREIENSPQSTNLGLENYGKNECVDKVTDLPGAVSCYDYLVKFGFQHCTDPYIQQNCCAAVKYICNRAPL